MSRLFIPIINNQISELYFLNKSLRNWLPACLPSGQSGGRRQQQRVSIFNLTEEEKLPNNEMGRDFPFFSFSSSSFLHISPCVRICASAADPAKKAAKNEKEATSGVTVPKNIVGIKRPRVGGRFHFLSSWRKVSFSPFWALWANHSQRKMETFWDRGHPPTRSAQPGSATTALMFVPLSVCTYVCLSVCLSVFIPNHNYYTKGEDEVS